ncbi:MAG: PfkB family carbohydrate kinase [Sphaerochaetaceae bacterium]|nr:PfkB family carbohydrate kinase [Sphaerochaetaceae bacterium]
MDKKFLVIGDIDTDLFLKVDHIPTWDEGLLADESQMLPGGKGANTTVQLAALGPKVSLMSCIGDDVFGKIGLTNLKNNELIDTSFIKTTSNPTTYCVMLLDNTGEKAIVVAPSVDIYPSLKMIEDSKCDFSSYENVHIIGLNPSKTLEYIEYLKQFDVSISVDLDSANGSEKQLLSIIDKSDIIFINKQGLHKLIKNVDDDVAVKKLGKKCKNTTIVCTLGSKGVMQVSNKEFTFEKANKINPVDTTGSGDSFIAGWLYVNFCLKDYNVSTKLKFANNCGETLALCLGGQGILLKNPEIGKDKIEFYEPFDAFGYLCNLSIYPFEYEGTIWPTSEQCYQAYKHTDEDYRRKIRECDDIYEVIELGRNVDSGSYDEYRWMTERVDVMYDIVLAKFSQNEDIKRLLLLTGDAKLIEHTKNDDFWGDNFDGTGENQLGKVLMKVRETLRKQSKRVDFESNN